MRSIFFPACYLFFSSLALAAGSFDSQLIPADGSTEFLAVGKPSFLKILGKGKGPEGTLKVVDGQASGAFTVHLSDLTTNNDMRDHHMKEKYLEVSKYPSAEFHLK